MKIIDLTEIYQLKFLREGNREEYENSFPELFDHYYQFWAKRGSDLAIVDSEAIRIRKSWIDRLIEALKDILERFEVGSNFIDLVYLIGAGSTNGHAFKYEDRYYVWLPLETYTSEKQTRVFVTHEIIHALHYNSSPSFYFNSRDELIQISRRLITEGLATFLTGEMLGISDLEALWADYLNESDARKWRQKCQEEAQNLSCLIYDNFYRSNRELEIFYALDPDNIYQFRSGYYAGLKLIEQYAAKYNLTAKGLLTLPRDKFEKDIFNLIRLQL